MEQSGAERRQFSRLHLLAYGSGKLCELFIDGECCTADLIDISAGGARVKLLPAQESPAAKQLVFSVQNVRDNGLLQKLPAVVRWRDGMELGIQFHTELDVGIVTLQKLVC